METQAVKGMSLPFNSFDNSGGDSDEDYVERSEGEQLEYSLFYCRYRKFSCTSLKAESQAPLYEGTNILNNYFKRPFYCKNRDGYLYNRFCFHKKPACK